MPDKILRLESFPFKPFTDPTRIEQIQDAHVSLHKLSPQALEAVLVSYAPGTILPRHSHSAPTYSIVLKGSIKTDSGTANEGSLILCDGPYGPRKTEEQVYLLVLQPIGTRYIPE